jgi:hypothetical protein
MVFLHGYNVLRTEAEHKERHIPQEITVAAKWLSPKTLGLHERSIFLRDVKGNLD